MSTDHVVEPNFTVPGSVSPNESSASADYSAGESGDCSYEVMEFLDTKILVVGVFGTSTALAGIGLNCLCAYILGKLAFAKAPALIYLFTLAVLDVFFLVSYILIFSVQIFFDYFESAWLYVAWNAYIAPVFTLSKMTQTASTYLIVSASVERFMDVGGFCGSIILCTIHRRAIVVFGVFLFSVLFRFVSFWEIEVHRRPCESTFESYYLVRSQFSSSPEYHLYSFLAVNIVQVFLPFFVLLLLNCGIFYQIRSAMKRNIDIFCRQSVWRGDKQKDSLKVATMMLVSIVFSYLISNILSVCITFVEHIHMDFLQEFHKFYTFAVDTINLLYVVTASTRLVIYGLCNAKIKQEVFQVLRLLTHQGKQFKEVASQEDSSRLLADLLPAVPPYMAPHHPCNNQI